MEDSVKEYHPLDLLDSRSGVKEGLFVPPSFSLHAGTRACMVHCRTGSLKDGG